MPIGFYPDPRFDPYRLTRRESDTYFSGLWYAKDTFDVVHKGAHTNGEGLHLSSSVGSDLTSKATLLPRRRRASR